LEAADITDHPERGVRGGIVARPGRRAERPRVSAPEPPRPADHLLEGMTLRAPPGRRHDGDPPVRREARSDSGEMPPEEPREQPPEAPAQPPPQRCVPAILVPAKSVPEVVPGPVQRDRDNPLRGHRHLRRGPEACKAPPPTPPGGGMADLADPVARRGHRRTRRERGIGPPQHLVPCHEEFMITDMRRDVIAMAHQQYGLLSVEQAKRLGYSESA